MDKNSKISESMEGNLNAEKWTFEKAEKLYLDAIKLSNRKELVSLRKGDSILKREVSLSFSKVQRSFFFE